MAAIASRGSKIFITYGEHDLTDNIIHFVLARLPDAPPGTKGISLFLVPKIMPGGKRNDVRAHSVEHKLGIHASPTCTMVYGDHGGAVGYLIGEENKGMACMFTMMNRARLAVGLQGVGIAERATQQALAYARERKQGGAGAIIAYPDVKRMLLTMRTLTGAARAICYATGIAIDRSLRAKTDAVRKSAHERASLLTPVAKAFSTDIGSEVASLGIQVHGGMGYIEETGAAQHYRDARIAAIYEGTNGIQALDLVTRKVPLEGGKTIDLYIDELRRTVKPWQQAMRRSSARRQRDWAKRSIASNARPVGCLRKRRPTRRSPARPPICDCSAIRLVAACWPKRRLPRFAPVTAPPAPSSPAFLPKISRSRRAASSAQSSKVPAALLVLKRHWPNKGGRPPMSLKGKTLFITGASRGIGLAIALKAASEGANIAIAAKTVEPHPKLEGTIHTAAAEIAKAGGRALPLAVDVRDDAAVQAALDEVAEKFGGIDIVVNNASAIQLTPVAATDMRRYDLMQQINARGTFMVSKFAIPYLARRENPHILMLSPPLDMAEKWFAPHTAYSMAKFGMSLVVLGLAGELRGKVAVNALWPRTTIATAAIKNLLGGDDNDAPVAQAGDHCRGGMPHFRKAQKLYRELSDRRHISGRRRSTRFRPIPRRSKPTAADGFLRARQQPAAQRRKPRREIAIGTSTPAL